MNFTQSTHHHLTPLTHTTSPMYTGTSVIGIKFKNGIIIAGDTRVNYGSLCKIMNVEDRIQSITPRTLVGYSGEYSDCQETSRILHELALNDSLEGSGAPCLGPVELANYLSSIHYYKRNKMDPYLNSVVCGGVNWDGKIVLLNIDPYGTLLKGNYFTTSISHYFCNAIIAPEYPKDVEEMTKEKAIQLIEKCFEILLYRDCNAGKVVKYSIIEKQDNEIKYDEGKITIKGKWSYDGFKNYGNEQFYLNA